MVGRVQIGDIVEIVTQWGVAYAQYSHWNALCGELLRVLPGFHDVRPSDFAAIVKWQEAFFAFLPLQAAVAQGSMAVIAHEDVPKAAQPFPLFRVRGGIEPATGRVLDWWLWDGEQEWKVENLSPEQWKLSVRSIWDQALLVARLNAGWMPAKEDATAVKHQEHHHMTSESAPTLPLLHYMYFQNEAEAKHAAHLLTSNGYSTEVRPSSVGTTWLVLVSAPFTQEAQRIAVMRSRLEEVAAALGGQYDGWAMPIT